MKKFFGIIGNPIKHTLSPLLHNYWLKKYNIDANYSIIEVDENDDLYLKIINEPIFKNNKFPPRFHPLELLKMLQHKIENH